MKNQIGIIILAALLVLQSSGIAQAQQAVDLGLSVKWASCNLGATRPEEYGNYYAFGETSPKTEYSWATYKWCKGSYNTLFKYNLSTEKGEVDNRGILELEDDVAREMWGGNWRIPTNLEWQELKDKCNWYESGNGYRITGPNGNSIYLPAAGYCSDAYKFDEGEKCRYRTSNVTVSPFEGLTVRPVTGVYAPCVTLEAKDIYPISARLLARTELERGTIGFCFSSQYMDAESLLQKGQKTQGSFSKAGGYHMTVESLHPGTTYYYVAYVLIGDRKYLGKVRTFVTGVQQAEAVDLGLSVKWGTCNLGAKKPWEYGNYYAWGETEPKANYSSDTYKVSSFVDVATVLLGAPWRMPSDKEWTELKTKCTWEWSSLNSVKGYKVTGVNGNWIFLPAAGLRVGTNLYGAGSYGDYWSSSLYTDSPDDAWYVNFNSGDVDGYGNYRYYGLSVRPVSE